MLYKSEKCKSMYETVCGLYKIGLIDDKTLTFYLNLCCTNIEETDLI